MTIINFFMSKKEDTALIAKKRLKIIISEQRKSKNNLKYFSKLKYELIQVIKKYVKICPESFSIQLEKKKNLSILEFHLILLKNKD